MEIELTTTTKPHTITRKEAAAIIGRHITIINRDKKADLIDWGRIGRHVRIVVNKKWNGYIKTWEQKEINYQKQNKKL